MEYELTPEYIMMIHEDNIKTYGGEYGIREQGTFEMLCEAPYQSIFGTDLYPTLFDKAAKFVEGFATHQVFYDGNKRTGLGAMNHLLNANGYELTMINTEVYQFVLDIANHKYSSIEKIADVIKSNVRQGFQLPNNICKENDQPELNDECLENRD